MKSKIHVMGSGSKGNATLIYNDSTTLLIDLGVTQERLIEGLEEIGKKIEDIDFAFFTHDHNDHIKNHHIIDSSKRYALKGTIELDDEHILKAYKSYKFGSYMVTPVSTSHDATNPCGYIITSIDEKIVYLTDSGRIPVKTLRMMSDANVYFIESNYDDEMLANSGRPQFLIERIYSNHGHLSNTQSAKYMSKLISTTTEAIILAHISEDCNTPDVALNTHYAIYNDEGLDIKNIDIRCAKQWESIDL